ncbi:hypothetical protein KI387_016785, partial [Taxus chinensis]
DSLGLPIPQPYLSLSAHDDAILQGANYASGGAGILNETGFLFVIYNSILSINIAAEFTHNPGAYLIVYLNNAQIERLSFDKQIDHFEATKVAIKRKVGARKGEKLCNEALYFIGMGSNDFINNYLLPVATDAQKYSARQFIDLLISTLLRQLTRLHEAGARKMVFHGVGPLGCIPSQRYKSGISNETCLNGLNSLIVEFNEGVEALLRRLNSRLPRVKITYADTYTAVMKLIQNPQAYGLRNSTAPCCNVDTSLGQLCLPNSVLCSDRGHYVFWDAFHPTDAANLILARHLLSHPDILQYSNKHPATSPSPAP